MGKWVKAVRIQTVTELREKGIVVVRATRVGAGIVAPRSEDQADGVLTSNTLTPQKARILLMLAIATTGELHEMQRMLDEY